MLWNTFEANRALLKAQYDVPCGGRGTDVAVLRENVAQIVGETAGCSLMTVKAECLSLVMRSMKVEICPQEFFADRFDHGNIMQDFFWHRADFVRERCPGNAAADRNSRTVGAVWANMDFSHISPDWSFVLGQGIPGTLPV